MERFLQGVFVEFGDEVLVLCDLIWVDFHDTCLLEDLAVLHLVEEIVGIFRDEFQLYFVEFVHVTVDFPRTWLVNLRRSLLDGHLEVLFDF